METRSKAVQKWIANDPLRNAWWTERCPSHSDVGDPCTLSFHLSSPNGDVKRVSCWRHGTLAVRE